MSRSSKLENAADLRSARGSLRVGSIPTSGIVLVEHGWFMHSTCNGDFACSNRAASFCGVTDGIDEPSGLENHFPRGIASLNLAHTVWTRSSARMERLSSKQEVGGLNPSVSVNYKWWGVHVVDVNSRKRLQGPRHFCWSSGFTLDYNCSHSRACSLVWLKRFAHNELILGSNPSRPIEAPAYNLLCGVGSTKSHATGERNVRGSGASFTSGRNAMADVSGCSPEICRFKSYRSDSESGVQPALWRWKRLVAQQVSEILRVPDSFIYGCVR